MPGESPAAGGAVRAMRAGAPAVPRSMVHSSGSSTSSTSPGSRTGQHGQTPGLGTPTRQPASSASQPIANADGLSLSSLEERLQLIEKAIREASGEQVPQTPAGVRSAMASAHEAANTVLAELEVVKDRVAAESSLRWEVEEKMSHELRKLEARLEEGPALAEKSVTGYVERCQVSFMQAVEAVSARSLDNQQAISDIRQVLKQTGARIQSVEDFCAGVDRNELSLTASFSAGTGMQESARPGPETVADWSSMSLERLQFEDKLRDELEKLQQRQDEINVALRKHVDSMMEATIDTNHQASSLVLAQLDELSGRMQKESQNMVMLEDKVSQEIQRIAKMYQELGSAMTHQLRAFEDSNQQAAQSIELHGKHAREGLAEANLRFNLLESRCATIDERLLEQHDRLLDKIEKVTLSVEILAGPTGESKEVGQAKASGIVDRLLELEDRTGCMVPVDEINKMFEYERDQREAGLKHLLTSVIEENLKSLKGLETSVNKRLNSETVHWSHSLATARSQLEQQIAASMASRQEGLPSQSEHLPKGSMPPPSQQQQLRGVAEGVPSHGHLPAGYMPPPSQRASLNVVAVPADQQTSGVPPQASSACATPGSAFRSPSPPLTINRPMPFTAPTVQPPAVIPAGFVRPLYSPPRSPPQSPASSRVGSVAALPPNGIADVSRLHAAHAAAPPLLAALQRHSALRQSRAVSPPVSVAQV